MHIVDKINLLGRAISFYTHSIRKNWVMNNKAIVIEIVTGFTHKIFGVNKSSSDKLSVQIDFHYDIDDSIRMSGTDKICKCGSVKKFSIKRPKYLEVMISFPSGDELSYILPILSPIRLVNPYR